VDDVNFDPVSMASGHGCIACGGNEGELYLGELGGNPLEKVHHAFKMSIQGKINNSMELYKSNSDVRILIANNDNSIKSFSIAGQSVVCSVNVPNPANYCSMNNDGNCILAVGDCNYGWMFDVRAHNEFIKTGEFGVSWDAGFSCAWSRNGQHIAVAAQVAIERYFLKTILYSYLHSRLFRRGIVIGGILPGMGHSAVEAALSRISEPTISRRNWSMSKRQILEGLWSRLTGVHGTA